MGDAACEGPPFPSMLLSKHIPSAKKTPICSTCKGCQSATQRVTILMSRACLYPPLQGGPAFLLPASLCSARRLSYVHLRAHRDVLYIRLRKYLPAVLWLPRKPRLWDRLDAVCSGYLLREVSLSLRKNAAENDKYVMSKKRRPDPQNSSRIHRSLVIRRA
jgi:hypothetical protein